MAQSAKRKLGYDDLADMPDDGRVREILDGALFVTPSPTPRHQRVVKRLSRQLDEYFEGNGAGEVFIAPLDTILGPHDIAEPDLMVVTNPASITARAIEAAPALVVEVLSPSTVVRDRAVKARRYAASGIAHYWIVDIDRQRIECHRLERGEYRLAAAAEGDKTLAPADWPGLRVDLARLWR